MMVSVIMPVLNAEKYLKESVESILNQTYKNFEFIIINDGSTDGSKEILKFYALKDRRIRLIHQKNQGVAKSLNKAIDLSKGSLIARQDADDISYSDRLKTQVTYLTEFNFDFIFSRSISWIHRKYVIVPRDDIINNFSFNKLVYGNFFTHGTFLCRAEVLKKERYDENFLHVEDYELFCRLISLNYFFFITPEILYFLRLHEESVSRLNSKVQFEYAKKVCLKYFGTSIFLTIRQNFFIRLLLRTPLKKFLTLAEKILIK